MIVCVSICCFEITSQVLPGQSGSTPTISISPAVDAAVFASTTSWSVCIPNLLAFYGQCKHTAVMSLLVADHLTYFVPRFLRWYVSQCFGQEVVAAQIIKSEASRPLDTILFQQWVWLCTHMGQ